MWQKRTKENDLIPSTDSRDGKEKRSMTGEREEKKVEVEKGEFFSGGLDHWSLIRGSFLLVRKDATRRKAEGESADRFKSEKIQRLHE